MATSACCGCRSAGLDPQAANHLPADARETVPCQMTETPGAGPGSSVPTGWRPSATASSPSPPHCSSWTSRFTRRAHRWTRFFGAWPAYLAYVVSFLTIGATWLAHTSLTGRLTRSDPIFLQINLLGLLVVAFLPFPTRLVADALYNTGAERVAVTVYGLTLLAIRTLGSALDAYARREHLYSPQADGDQVQVPRRKLLPVVIGYVIAILIGLLVPLAAVALYFGIAVYLMVPFRQVARLLLRRP